MIGDYYANPPPAHALAERGMIRNVVAYSIYGRYAPPDALARRDIDVAIVWEPFAGAYHKRAGCRCGRAGACTGRPAVPSVRVRHRHGRRGDSALRDQLNAILSRHRDEIAGVLDEFGVPGVEATAAGSGP